MAEQWYAICRDSSHALVSLGTVVADPLPAGLHLHALDKEPTGEQMWNPATQGFIPRPPKVVIDRLTDLEADPDYQEVAKVLSPIHKPKLQAAIIRLLGRQRWRGTGQPTSL